MLHPLKIQYTYHISHSTEYCSYSCLQADSCLHGIHCLYLDQCLQQQTAKSMFPLSNEIWIVQTHGYTMHCVASQYFIFKQGYWTEISVWSIDFCCCFFLPFIIYSDCMEEEQCHRKCALLIYSHTNTAWTTKVYKSTFKKSFLTVSYAGTPTCIPDTSSYTCNIIGYIYHMINWEHPSIFNIYKLVRTPAMSWKYKFHDIFAIHKVMQTNHLPGCLHQIPVINIDSRVLYYLS